MKLKQPSMLMILFLSISILFFSYKTYGVINQSGMDEQTKAKYKAASPLNHTVKITRTGSILKFDYELIGTDGEIYDLWEINDQSRPVFSIYHDNKQIDSGTFQFG